MEEGCPRGMRETAKSLLYDLLYRKLTEGEGGVRIEFDSRHTLWAFREGDFGKTGGNQSSARTKRGRILKRANGSQHHCAARKKIIFVFNDFDKSMRHISQLESHSPKEVKREINQTIFCSLI